jgi:hypothetical protein
MIHAYRQAPWRVQRQWIGTLLLVVAGLAMIAALYLDVTSQAAIAGRRIQEMTDQMNAVQQNNADLESKLADLTSTSAMQQRGEALGYQPADASQLQYVEVPGYKPPEPAILAGAGALRPSPASMPPEYTESLISWLSRHFGGPSGVPLGAGR